MVNFYRFKRLGLYDKLLHGITTKSAQYPFSFSLALHTGEEKKEIITNRKKLETLLGSDETFHFVVANQTHSDHIKVIKEQETKGWYTLENAIEDCDALITDCKSVMLTVLTADCVPVLLYDEKQEVIAVIHAGWKGTKAEITLKTVQKMVEEFSSDPSDIVAGIAPAIGKCCYEVDENVAKHFFMLPESYQKVGEKYMLDLASINKKQLLDVGVKAEHIEMSHICTACEVESFFSYRKEQGCSGRFMSMIGMRA